MMITRSRSYFVYAFMMMLYIPAGHAAVDTETLGNTIDVLSAIVKVATAGQKPGDVGISPSEEQRVMIINEIAKGAGNASNTIKQTIIDTQSSLQSILESASCSRENTESVIAANQFITSDEGTKTSNFPINTQKNVCANVVRIDQWKMPQPDVLEFAALFRLEHTQQAKSWRFSLKRMESGAWSLQSRTLDINKN